MATKEFDIKDFQHDYRDDAPAVYVSTYAKYNAGRLDGAWLDLTSFADYDEFMEVLRWLHRDEQYPEFMFQDYENFPRELYNEMGMDEDTFDKIREFAEVDNREAFQAFIEWKGADATVEQFNDAYYGEFDSERDFAEYIASECDLHENLRYYFDFDKYARDLFYDDFYFENGYVFSQY